jgi:hypothetical protein
MMPSQGVSEDFQKEYILRKYIVSPFVFAGLTKLLPCAIRLIFYL